MSEIIDRGAEAMRAKRRELIAQPLDRIWPELMRAAVAAMREPTAAMIDAGDFDLNEKHTPANSVPATVQVWHGMIDAALEAPAPIAEAKAWRALRAFYRWYDLDGSVGGAANVFEDHREVVMAYLHANLPDKDQASPGYTQYTGFRP